MDVNTRLGIKPEPYFKIARRCNGSIKIYVSLETIMKPLALFFFFLLLLLLLILTLQVREFKYSPLQHADYPHFTFTSRRKSHDRQIAVNNSGLATCYICHFLQFLNNPLFCLVGARTLWKRLSVCLSVVWKGSTQ